MLGKYLLVFTCFVVVVWAALFWCSVIAMVKYTKNERENYISTPFIHQSAPMPYIISTEYAGWMVVFFRRFSFSFLYFFFYYQPGKQYYWCFACEINRNTIRCHAQNRKRAHTDSGCIDATLLQFSRVNLLGNIVRFG